MIDIWRHVQWDTLHFLFMLLELGSMLKENTFLHSSSVFLNECHPSGIAIQTFQWNSSHADSGVWEALKLSPIGSNSAPEGSLEFNITNHTGTVIFCSRSASLPHASTHTTHTLMLHPSRSFALTSRLALTLPTCKQRATTPRCLRP